MGSYFHSSDYCYDIVSPIYYKENRSSSGVLVNLTNQNIESLKYFCDEKLHVEVEDKYNEPVAWIGIYISIASLFCILAMAADLWNGFRKRKYCFPCKYFSLNAVSITMIAVAMKLPMDLNSPMGGYVDQLAKQGSLIFMCVMIANLIPSLASMDNKALFANVIGLAILIITMIVNVYMQMNTGVIEHKVFSLRIGKYTFIKPHFMNVAYIYVAMLLFFLVILISSAIIVPTSKQILQLKYQATMKTTLINDQYPNETFAIEKLREHMKRYWIMAETGSPQFVMANNPLSFASGVICVIGLAIYINLLSSIFMTPILLRYQSDYKWSVIAIVTTQSIGVVVGVVAPIFRCSTVVSFKSFSRWNRNHLDVFKVETYWIKELCEWKESHITFLSNGRRSRRLMRILKNLVLIPSIGFQKAVVVTCKIIGLILVLVLLIFMCCSYYFMSLKEMIFSPPSRSSDDIGEFEELSNYVLFLEDNMELSERTFKRISNSINHLIEKAEKEQDNNLVKFLENSIGRFEGVEKFDIYEVQPLLSIKLPNSWSLPIVTLTCIAIALPNIGKDATNWLIKCVGEGLFYTRVVEENLNNGCKYVNIQKATMALWDEVEDNHKWLGKTLEKNAYKGKTSREILEWFAHKAEEIVIEVSKSTNEGESVEYLPQKLIVANSMYRIAHSIMLTYQSNILEITDEQLFALLSHMIADILVACFTNIPRVITMKCHESAIEKREASVEAAAKLLGRTTEIIKRLQMYQLPSIDHEKMAYIDEWRFHLQCIP
ncbi:hypothetical protein Lser_V15G10892 [Lactuca serriola]